MAAERLQKYLARAGVASRRHAEELITAGRVTVNNETVTELGSRVEPGTDLVSVDGTLVTPPDVSSYYLLYKPIGVVTTLSDPQGRPTVGNYVEETGKRLFPVGRLDYDAEGALLFTDDGALAHKLTHPSFQVPRMYLAKVKGVPDAATLDKLRGGVRLEDGMATPLSVDVFEAAERNTWLKIVVAEGRPHLIKRLCAAVGHPVVRLFRPAYAGIGVEGMRPGELRALKKSEVEQLAAVSEGRAQPGAVELRLPPRRHGRAAPGFDGDEDELSMDDESPAPRKASTTMERTALKAARAMDARPEKRERKPASAGGTGPARFGRTAGGDEGRPPRKAWGGGDAEGAPRERGAGAGRPVRKEWGAGGEDKPRGRGFGAGGDKPRGRSFGGDDKPRSRGFGAGSDDKPRGRGFGAGRTERGAGGEDKPRGRSSGLGAEDKSRGRGYAAVGAGRPERGAGTGRPVRKTWGAGGDEGAAPRSRGAGGEDKPRARGFGAGAAGRPERSEGGESRPRARGYGVGGAGRREFSAGGAGQDEGRPPRKTFGRGGEGGTPRGARPERREFSPRGGASGGPRGAGRPERREFSPRGPEGAAPRGRSGPGRPGFGAGARGTGSRPERKEWSPTDARGNPNERVVRGGARRGPAGERAGGEKSKGFQDWGKKKERGVTPRFTSGGPRGGAGRPPPRGPRRPR